MKEPTKPIKDPKLKGIDARCGTCGKVLPITTRGKFARTCPDHKDARVSFRATFQTPSSGGIRGKRFSQSCNSESEARVWLAERSTEYATKGDVTILSKAPLAVVARQWVESMEPDLSINGYATYLRALPHIEHDPTGSVPVAKVTVGDLRDMKARWLETNAVASVKVWASIVRGTMTELQAEGAITKNPALKGLRIQKDAGIDEGNDTDKAWTRDEWNVFLDHVEGDQLEALWSVLAWSGMRRGEALALRWDDIADEPNSNGLYVIEVRRNLVDSFRDGRILLSATKSGKAGVAHIPQPAMDALDTWRHEQNVQRMASLDWIDDGYMFTKAHGMPWKPATISTRFRRMVDKLDVTPISLHGLRHTALTLAMDAGAKPIELQDMARHANYSTTESKYLHRVGEGIGVLALQSQRVTG